MHACPDYFLVLPSCFFFFSLYIHLPSSFLSFSFFHWSGYCSSPLSFVCWLFLSLPVFLFSPFSSVDHSSFFFTCFFFPSLFFIFPLLLSTPLFLSFPVLCSRLSCCCSGSLQLTLDNLLVMSENGNENGASGEDDDSSDSPASLCSLLLRRWSWSDSQLVLFHESPSASCSIGDVASSSIKNDFLESVPHFSCYPLVLPSSFLSACQFGIALESVLFLLMFVSLFLFLHPLGLLHVPAEWERERSVFFLNVHVN